MLSFFFFNGTATTEIYTLSIHDALPISTGADHTIAGFGQISGALINNGLVLADDRFGSELQLTESTNQNNATMMAENGGILSLFSGIVRGGVLYTSNGGSIDGGTGDGAPRRGRQETQIDTVLLREHAITRRRGDLEVIHPRRQRR